MAKVNNFKFKTWGLNSTRTGEVGSVKDTGILSASKDPTVIQTDAYEYGFEGNNLSNAPFLEDFDSVLYTQDLKTLLIKQEGILTYDATETYYIGSIVRESGTSKLYKSLIDNNTGNALSSITDWALLVNLDTIETQLSSSQVTKQSILTYRQDNPIFQNPAMTSNTLPVGYVASATTNDSTAWRLFDATTTAWASTTSPTFPQDLTLQGSSSQYIERVKIVNGSSADNHIRNATIQGSDNGTDWDDLLIITDRENTNLYEESYILKTPVKYSYVRVRVDSYWGTTGALSIREIEVIYGQKKLTQSTGFINAKDFSSYINFANEIDIDFATNGLNALSTNTTLSANTWYYIFACVKVDGTVGAIIDSAPDGSDALIDFGNAGFDTDTMILSGVWKTDVSSNLESGMVNSSPNIYNSIDVSRFTTDDITNYTGIPVASSSGGELYPAGYKLEICLMPNTLQQNLTTYWNIYETYKTNLIRNFTTYDDLVSIGESAYLILLPDETGSLTITRDNTGKVMRLSLQHFKIL